VLQNVGRPILAAAAFQAAPDADFAENFFLQEVLPPECGTTKGDFRTGMLSMSRYL
jgi:hypothetical protein